MSVMIEDISEKLGEHLALIVPWLEPALRTIENDRWTVQRRQEVLANAAHCLVYEFIHEVDWSPNDPMESLGKYVAQAALELSLRDRHKNTPEPYKIPDHVLETSECS